MTGDIFISSETFDLRFFKHFFFKSAFLIYFWALSFVWVFFRQKWKLTSLYFWILNILIKVSKWTKWHRGMVNSGGTNARLRLLVSKVFKTPVLFRQLRDLNGYVDDSEIQTFIFPFLSEKVTYKRKLIWKMIEKWNSKISEKNEYITSRNKFPFWKKWTWATERRIFSFPRSFRVQ